MGTRTRRSAAAAASESTAAAASPVAPYAYQVSEVVWAWHEPFKGWRKATVISSERPALGPAAARTQLYIHWNGLDRRLDQWIDVELVRRLALEDELEGRKESDCESDDAHAGMDAEYLKEHVENTKFKTIQQVSLGKYLIDCWYFSPYPVEVQNVQCLRVCVFCLSFFKSEVESTRHAQRCTARHPPGNEIYRDTERRLSMWEVDGTLGRVYCENLCFLSKLFLDHKTLRHPVSLFLFYVMTEHEDDGFHVVGYFSKEKYSRNNVSCIMVLPQHQKKGYGKYLINFSYALALKEGRRGTPERPLSDLGLVSYLRFWRQTLLMYLKENRPPHVRICDIADALAFEPEDIITTLKDARMIDAEPTTGALFLFLSDEYHELLTARLGPAPAPIDPLGLRWLPYDPFLGPYEFVGS